MNCRKCAGLLSAYLDGELTHELSSRVKAHLVHCQACRKQHLALAALREELRSLPPVACPDKFGEALKRRLLAETRQNLQFRWSAFAERFSVPRSLRLAGTGALVALIALLAVTEVADHKSYIEQPSGTIVLAPPPEEPIDAPDGAIAPTKDKNTLIIEPKAVRGSSAGMKAQGKFSGANARRHPSPAADDAVVNTNPLAASEMKVTEALPEEVSQGYTRARKTFASATEALSLKAEKGGAPGLETAQPFANITLQANGLLLEIASPAAIGEMPSPVPTAAARQANDSSRLQQRLLLPLIPGGQSSFTLYGAGDLSGAWTVLVPAAYARPAATLPAGSNASLEGRLRNFANAGGIIIILPSAFLQKELAGASPQADAGDIAAFLPGLLSVNGKGYILLLPNTSLPQ